MKELEREVSGVIAEVGNKGKLLKFLLRDRGLAAYFIGDLEEPHWSRSSWFGRLDAADDLDALALMYRHPCGPTLLALGEDVGLDEIFAACRDRWPESFHSHVLTTHVPVYERYYRLEEGRILLRMVLRRGEPFHGADDESRPVRRLSRADLPDIHEALLDYPDNCFEPAILDTGYYFGAYDGDELAAMAGVHVVSQEHGIAMLGNIVTRRSQRRKGYGRLCTERVVRELFGVLDTIALNVYEDNEGAIALYERLGFKRHARFLFARCEKLSASVAPAAL